MRSKETEQKILDRLPGDLPRVAKLIGLKNTMKLVDEFGGSYLSIAKCDDLRREIRDNEIRELYDTGKYTIRELALKFKLTDRSISTILGKEEAEVPLPLLELMQ